MDSRIKSNYIRYRVEDIKNKLNAQQISYSNMIKKDLFEYINNGFKDLPEEQKREDNFSDFSSDAKYDEWGFTQAGFDRNGIHKTTKTKYDEEGFDRSGYNKDYMTRAELKS